MKKNLIFSPSRRRRENPSSFRVWIYLFFLFIYITSSFCYFAQAAEEEADNNAGKDEDDPSQAKNYPPMASVSGKESSDADGKSNNFMHGFIATLSVIIVSELGDKTFFIAAIMAMRQQRLIVFSGAMSALALMHVMSAFFGWAITIIPRIYTYYVSAFLFALFGIKMLKEGWNMSPDEGKEEMEEVQEDLRKREGGKVDEEAGLMNSSNDNENKNFISKILCTLFSPIFIQAFTMTFLAEWGDRSQLATIVLAASENINAVVIAGILGHGLCTGLAVLGGRMIASKISVRTVTLIGGVVFILFAMTALCMDPEET